MAGTSVIREHMEVIGADGVHIGTVDRLEGARIKLTKRDSGEGSHKGHPPYAPTGPGDGLEAARTELAEGASGEGSHKGHHHYVPTALVAEVEGERVRLSANAD